MKKSRRQRQLERMKRVHKALVNRDRKQVPVDIETLGPTPQTLRPIAPFDHPLYGRFSGKRDDTLPSYRLDRRIVPLPSYVNARTGEVVPYVDQRTGELYRAHKVHRASPLARLLALTMLLGTVDPDLERDLSDEKDPDPETR